MEYFDFEDFESGRRSGAQSAPLANHESHGSSPNAPNLQSTYQPWLHGSQSGFQMPQAGPYDLSQWSDSLPNTPGTPFQEYDTPLTTPLDSLNNDIRERSRVATPTHNVGGTYMNMTTRGSIPESPGQNDYAAMEANSQELRDWFAQSGRRDSRSRRPFPRRRSLYSRNSGVPIGIPKQTDLNWATLDPLQRWQNSPPENEPASISAISNAVAATDLNQYDQGVFACSSNVSTPGVELPGFNVPVKRSSRPASISSIDSGTSAGSFESMLSSRSCGSRRSASSSSRKPGRSTAKVTKGRKSTGAANNERLFQCTFCCDTFKNKYDWTRHEKSLHLNPERWTCIPSGESVLCPTSGKRLCAYCLSEDLTKEHLQSHNHGACAHKDTDARSFKRKDHLLQHLRLVHKIDAIPAIGPWKAEEVVIKSRCGFCGVDLDEWKTRAEHLSKHFRDGTKMSEWRGSHGFEPQIARQVTNSMPPFLIGNESKTLIPFSATKPGHQEHLAQMSSRVPLTNSLLTTSGPMSAAPAMDNNLDGSDDAQFKTCWDFLTFQLGRFAQEQMKAGVVPTDEMFQQESRRLWFDSDDPWNQTVADLPEWLETFRQEHGLYGINDQGDGQS